MVGLPTDATSPVIPPVKSKFGLRVISGLVILLLLLFTVSAFLKKGPSEPGKALPRPSFLEKVKGVQKFSSEEEFKAYLTEGKDSGLSLYGRGRAGEQLSLPAFEGAPSTGIALAPPGFTSLKQEVPSRISQTNVQVAGIDEPDIVKTDGKQIYFSSQLSYYPLPLFREAGEGIMPPMPPYPSAETRVIKAFPPEELVKLGKISKTGNLLLYKNVLLVFSDEALYGFNISNPSSPQEKWKLKLEENNSLVQARLYKEKVYLVTRTQVNPERPCPIELFSLGGAPISIRCGDIYHPLRPIPVDVTYTALTLNPQNGSLEEKVSFVGSSGSSVVYMSPQTLYVTYAFEADIVDLMSNFFKEKGQDLIPTSIMGKIERLKTYDLSQAAKITEFEWILAQYKSSLSNDERLRIENEIENRLAAYTEEHERELQKTGVIAIDLLGLKISGIGEIPGSLLNQFSLDEYNNYLRVATTVGSWDMRGSSANDVYVLDQNLKIVGSVKDLGLKERIYSARFIGDKGYLVTFRQTDPFYVLDLSNPKNPQLKGELKIPGYSSYLHPLAKNKILGVGKEGAQVKISLFDVSSAENPVEEDKYILSEYTSDILETAHAFLQDVKHQVFFLPGGQGAYIFSYKGDKLTLARAVSEISAKRAVYLNDYLYVIGDNKLVVLNETDWEKINEIDL